MSDKIAIMLELERRGSLPEDKVALLSEARRRGLIEGSSTQELPKEENNGLLGSVADNLGKRVSNIGSVFKNDDRYESKAVQIAGQVAGGLIVDPATELMKSGYRNLVPDVAQEAIASGFSSAMKNPTVQTGVKFLGDVYKSANERYPEGMRNVEAVANIAGAVPIIKGVGAIASGVKSAGKEAVAIAGDIAKIIVPSETATAQKIKNVVRPVLEKTILSKRVKNTEQYLSKGVDSTVDIISNKNSLKFVAGDGTTVEGQLPKNYNQWKDAILQREGETFREFDAMNKAAGGKGAVVDLLPLADKLEKYGLDKVVMTENPQAAKYALAKAAAYREAGSYTAEEAQQAMVELNARFQNFLKSPSPEKAVDVISGNNIREGMYEAVKQYEGEGYERLRKIFGAHKEISSDVHKKAIQELTKSGNTDWLDIIAGAEFSAGILTMNPIMMTRAGAYEVLKKTWKYYNSPHRAIKNMFDTVDSISEKSSPVFKSGTMKSLTGRNKP